MQYWHNLITEKSFQLLKRLNRDYQFILIGGWAVFLYARTLKSKDVDIIIGYEELSKLKARFEVFKNSRLKKYEFKQEGIDVDIYLPYFSNPGLPAEEIEKFTISKEGFRVPLPEILLILKQAVFAQRKNTPKGTKDKIDIFVLLTLPELNWERYKKILKIYDLSKLSIQLKTLLKETSQLKEVNLSSYKIAKLKKEIFEKLGFLK